MPRSNGNPITPQELYAIPLPDGATHQRWCGCNQGNGGDDTESCINFLEIHQEGELVGISIKDSKVVAGQEQRYTMNEMDEGVAAYVRRRATQGVDVMA